MKKQGNVWIVAALATAVTAMAVFFQGQKTPLLSGDPVVEAVYDPSGLVKQTLQETIRSQHFKGVVLVVQDDQIIYQDSYGYADLSKLAKNSLQIAYPIASLQKFMTGVLIAQQITAGQLSYETNIHAFYPEIPQQAGIKIRSLLDHTSGIRMDEADPGVLLGTEEAQLNYVLQAMTLTDDHTFAYTNANYTLLSGIVAKIAQKDYETVLEEKIIAPLHLKHTYSWLNRPHEMVFPRGYQYAAGGDYQDDQFSANQRLFSSLLGAGNLFMTIGDMLKVQQGLTNGTLLSTTAYQELSEIENAGYAGGIWHEEGIKSIHGSLGGYDTFVYGQESNQNLVILFSNQPAIDGNEALATRIYQLITE